MRTEHGRSRVVVAGVRPEIDGGQFPIKRVIGDLVIVEADAFADGHDAISAAVRYRKQGAAEWAETPMEFLTNDRWHGSFTVLELGRYEYTVTAWIDRFKTWSRDLAKRVAADQDVTVDLLIGAAFVDDAVQRATALDAGRLELFGAALRAGGSEGAEAALSSELAELMARHSERLFSTDYTKQLLIWVERERARFSAWYELFPRSFAAEAGKHGTFNDVIANLPYVASMGFDILYLPPIHPIGRSFRKGPNNTVVSGPGDPGSPWAIGAAEGGHKDIHPELGTLDDFRTLIKRAAEHGLEMAMDIAFQCAPDHPYVKEHPNWFRQRPDGTIQYAENPPKKYQDIYPFDFETEDWEALWDELRSVIQYWIDQGIRIFRVDNPHTKPFSFWAWLIDDVKRANPETIFLSEAFTRPKVMYSLAKLGFTQSYNYFPWRNTKEELTAYLTELTQTEVREYFGANLWPNTPDILPESLQYGGRAAFMARFILAATLGPSYGIYGPAFELCEARPLAPSKEEYLDSEKFEIRRWDLERPDSLRKLIGHVNQIRRENSAFHQNHELRFHPTENEQIIAYSKTSVDGANQVLVIVNLDPHHTQAGMVSLPLDELTLDRRQTYQVHDLLTGSRYLWHGERNYVELNPQLVPANIFILRRRTHTEHDFDYYM